MSFFVNNAPNQNPQLSVKLQGTDDSANERTVTLSAPQNSSSLTSDVTLVLPPNDGTSGQYLQTDGDGNLSWATVNTASSIGTTTVASSGQTITLSDPTNYVVTGSNTVTFTLPATANVGDTWYISSAATGNIVIDPGSNTLTSRVTLSEGGGISLTVASDTTDVTLDGADPGKMVTIVALTTTTFLMDAMHVSP